MLCGVTAGQPGWHAAGTGPDLVRQGSSCCVCSGPNRNAQRRPEKRCGRGAAQVPADAHIQDRTRARGPGQQSEPGPSLPHVDAQPGSQGRHSAIYAERLRPRQTEQQAPLRGDHAGLDPRPWGHGLGPRQMLSPRAPGHLCIWASRGLHSRAQDCRPEKIRDTPREEESR